MRKEDALRKTREPEEEAAAEAEQNVELTDEELDDVAGGVQWWSRDGEEEGDW